MNQIYSSPRIVTLCSLFFILFLISCEKDTPLPNKQDRVAFSLAMQSDATSEAWTRSFETSSNTISHVDYAIMDAFGKIITPPWHKLMGNSLVIEGLEAGAYSIAFFATTETKQDIPRPVEIDGHLMLINSNNTLPLNVDYLFKRIDFTVDGTNTSKTVQVSLKRCVGRVEVDITSASSALLRLITAIEINLDKDNGIYLQHSDVENGYSESDGSLKRLELKPNAAGFYSFPSATPLSGTITIKSKLFDDTPVENTYRFSNLVIEAGKVSYIKVNWKSPAAYDEKYISESDYTSANLKEILKNETPAEIQSCSFSTNKPLQVKMGSDKKLHLRFYGPITIRGITIMCRMKSISPDFFKLAYYDMIPRFSESSIEPPIVQKAGTYIAESGKLLYIDKQYSPNPADYEFKIVTDDDYMTKVMAIKYPMLLSFNYPGPFYWGLTHSGGNVPADYNKDDPFNPPLSPYIARHASVMAVNLSYLFSSKEFEDAVTNYSGYYGPYVFCRDTAKMQSTKVPTEILIARARGVKKMVLGMLRIVKNPPVLAWGTAQGMSDLYPWQNLDLNHRVGEKMALQGGIYEQQYSNSLQQLLNGGPKNTIFHEFGHLMGFTHASSVASFENRYYLWQKVCTYAIKELESNRKLPISEFRNLPEGGYMWNN